MRNSRTIYTERLDECEYLEKSIQKDLKTIESHIKSIQREMQNVTIIAKSIQTDQYTFVFVILKAQNSAQFSAGAFFPVFLRSSCSIA